MATIRATRKATIKRITSQYFVVLDQDGVSCGHLHRDARDASACRAEGGQILRLVEPSIGPPPPTMATRQLLAGRIDPPTSVHPPAPPTGTVHPTAVIGQRTRIGSDVHIEAYAVVGDDVEIGDGCRLGAHSIVRSGSILGARSRIDSFAVIGGDPQDLAFDSRVRSGVRIGTDTTVREGVTVHRSSVPDGYTEIGNGALLMSHSHVAHDCRVGDSVILANNVMLAGHVQVQSHAFVAGGAGVHQFVRVGEGAMVGGNATVTYDIPPFTLTAERNLVYGLNLRGLRRRGFSDSAVRDLKNCYRTAFLAGGDAQRNARAAVAAGKCGITAPGRRFLTFFAESRRGFAHPRVGRAGSRPR